MNKKALTLTEVLIAISIGVVILIPVTAMFSSSSRLMEKSSNLSFATGLSRYIIQSMMTMKMQEIVPVLPPGISCCDDSDNNYYFKNLFNLNEACGDLNKGKISVGPESTPKLYARMAKYNFRYSITVSEDSPSGTAEDLIKSVCVFITWNEFGQDKSLTRYANIIQK